MNSFLEFHYTIKVIIMLLNELKREVTVSFYRKFFESLIILLFITILILDGEKAIAGSIEEFILNLKSRDPQIRLLAVEKLGRMRNGKAVNALLNLIFIKAEDWRIKIRAIRLLGEIDDPEVSEKLVKIFNDPFLNEECPAIKLNTAIALGKDFNKGSRVVDSLIDVLNRDSLLIREAAIQSLGKIGDSKAVPFLIPELNDKSFAIKFSTVKALGNIGDPKASPFLVRIAYKEGDSYIRREAQSVLKKFSSNGSLIGYRVYSKD
jgi:HEAT repeat protein